MRASMWGRPAATRGTALVLAVVLSVIITGLIMSLAWAAGIQTGISANLIKVDNSFYVAESGAQRAAWYLKHSRSVTQPLTGTINGGSYSVTWTSIAAKTYRVTSIAAVGDAKNTVYLTVKVPTVQAAISVGGSLTLKNLTISGNAIVGDTADFSPGNAQVNGNLTYGGSAVDVGTKVTGTKTQDPWQSLDWTTVLNSLAANTKATGASGTGKTYNFSSLSGADKVIAVTGDVTDPIFVGTGTLYVTGKVKLGNNVGTSTSPVNIVATGDISLTSNLTYYGALYTKGTLTRRKLDLYGTIYAEEDIDSNTSGQSSFTFTTAPWFETRTSGGSAGSTQFLDFAGPQP